MSKVHFKEGLVEIAAHALNGFEPITYTKSLDDYIGEKFSIFNFTTEEATTVVAGANQQVELEALNESLPIEVVPIYQKKPMPKLILDLTFLHGYYEDNGYFNNNYSNYTPTISDTNSLTYSGISYLHWASYDLIDRNNPGLSDKLERFNVLITEMENLGLNHMRIEAMWNKIVPEINSISSSLHPNQIPDQGTMIDDYIAEIDSYGGWDTLDYFIDQTLASSVITSPYIVVGCGHSSRMPSFNDSGSLKRIAPGTVRPDTLSGYMGVTEDVYLYWLKKYTRAVVRRYKNKINCWQIENELNAARFTESFGWWRVGSAWGEDYAGGFQDRVIEILHDAVRLEDPGAEILTTFHLFEAAKRIKEWNEYIDIVGLQIYPHLFHAYPVLGFFTGEFVWAAKRILTAEGTPGKQVWITETGYPAKTTDVAPLDYASNIEHFSQERQKQFMEEAMYSCMQNGAKGFDIYRLYTEEADEASNAFEINNCYTGLYDEFNNQKLAAPAFKDVFEANNNLETVKFHTKTFSDESLTGTFNVEASVNALPSGIPVKLVPNKDYDVYANDQKLMDSQSELVQHYRWNNEDYHYLYRQFNSSQHILNQVAYYDNAYPIKFKVDIGPGIDTTYLTKKLAVRDTWYENRFKKQPNKYYSLGVSVDTTVYDVFLDQQYPNDNFYKLKAPFIGGATTDNIYVFDHWSGTGVNIIHPNNKYTAAVFLNESGMEVTAHYAPVLNRQGYKLVIPEDEYLEIPEGANYTFAQGFTIECQGDFNIHGTYDHPVTFTGSGKDANFDPTDDPPSDSLIVIKSNDSELYYNFVTIKNIECAFTLMGENNKLTYKHSAIENNNVGIHLGNIKNNEVLIDSITFKNNDIAVRIGDNMANEQQVSEININRCVLEDNYYDMFFEPKQNVTSSSEIQIKFYNSNFITHSSTSGYGIFLKDTSIPNGDIKAYLTNNIFLNTSCSLGAANYREADFNLSYPNTNSYLGSDVINQDPMFIDSENGNYHLSGNSPCIDAGVYTGEDYCPDYDPDGTELDIGRFHFPQLRDTIKTDMILSNEVRIVDDIIIPDTVTVTVLPGTVVKLETNVIIKVYGKFMAEGTQDSMITFTSVYDNPETSDYWDRIRFYDSANDSSIIKYCNIEYAKYAVYTAYSDISIESNIISNIRYHGLYCYESGVSIKNNDIQANHFVIYLYRGNYASQQPVVYGNKLHGGSRGLYMVYSSPYLQDNEIYDNDYGVYAMSYSAAYLGWMGEEGRNYIHNNDYNLSSSNSAVFMGRDMCMLNGGKNKMETFTNYQIYAANNSHIIAENNWWGGPPQPSYFNIDGTSSVDYMPYLSSTPFYKTGLSPEESAFNDVFSGAATDSALTEAEVMANFKDEWPIKQKLLYARNLVYLNFPQNAEKICKDVIQTYPDSSLSYMALNILWEAGETSSQNFKLFKVHLDSISSAKEDKEIYDEAELIRDGFNDEETSAASLGKSYTKYSYPQVAAKALFRDFLFVLYNKENINGAQSVLNTMKANYPNSPETAEAREQFQIYMADAELGAGGAIPKEYKLYANYPNPFNPKTTFKFGLPVDSRITIDIYNVLGQKVFSIARNSVPAGTHTLHWNGRNSGGLKLPSGLFIYGFKAQALNGKKREYFKSRKMILLK